MIFEEALKLLREGKKIRHPTFEDDVYLSGCYLTLKTIIDDDGNELADSLEDAKERGMSIVLMKGDRQHKDMMHQNFPSEQPCCNPKLHSFPQLNLFLIMSDDWEVLP
jgi:hypothetical protein